MIQKVALIIPDAAQKLLDAGELVRTNGVLRYADTKSIYKHLEAVNLEDATAIQELGSAFKRVVKEHKGVIAVVLTVTLVISATAGVIIHSKTKKQKAFEEKYNALLNVAIKHYTDAAQLGELDLNTIEVCEDALSSIPAITDKVLVSMTEEQMLEFTNSLHEYTLRLAEENGYNIEDEDALDYKGDMISFMLNLFKVQKDILQKRK